MTLAVVVYRPEKAQYTANSHDTYYANFAPAFKSEQGANARQFRYNVSGSAPRPEHARWHRSATWCSKGDIPVT